MGLTNKKNLKILHSKLKELVSEEVDDEKVEKTKPSVAESVDKLMKGKGIKKYVGRKRQATLIDGGMLLTCS